MSGAEALDAFFYKTVLEAGDDLLSISVSLNPN